MRRPESERPDIGCLAAAVGRRLYAAPIRLFLPSARRAVEDFGYTSVMWVRAWICGVLLLLAGCAERAPMRPAAAPARVLLPGDGVGVRAAALAASQVGSPYRFGGNSPNGFDCSGLVWFVYHELGIEVPRTAAEQHKAALAVPGDRLQPGDLVFFYTAVDHVGIYLGNGEFVHAPASGKTVTRARLDSPFFTLGFAGGGRLPMATSGIRSMN